MLMLIRVCSVDIGFMLLNYQSLVICLSDLIHNLLF